MRTIIAVALFAFVASTALAQQSSPASPGGATTQPQTQTPPATTGMGTLGQAPVGHRQPTQNDLPPSVRDNEDSPARGAPDPFGPVPQICRGC